MNLKAMDENTMSNCAGEDPLLIRWYVWLDGHCESCGATPDQWSTWGTTCLLCHRALQPLTVHNFKQQIEIAKNNKIGPSVIFALEALGLPHRQDT